MIKIGNDLNALQKHVPGASSSVTCIFVIVFLIAVRLVLSSRRIVCLFPRHVYACLPAFCRGSKLQNARVSLPSPHSFLMLPIEGDKENGGEGVQKQKSREPSNAVVVLGCDDARGESL